ncbi:MAG: GAF domain-containing protein [Kaiparowitsia implicata GSE-PSE-MK54-09C]|jgi:signal transduction histidine kinase|nr:GAF domain-containing protein [Kaiparowitsia implicata GSE-PSE-MK54-09C]
MTLIPEHPATQPSWQQAHRTLEILASLSYRGGDLQSYLRQVARGVSDLLQVDGTVVTLCQSEPGMVMVCTAEDSPRDGNVVSLHGTLTATVVRTGKTLAVADAQQHPEYGAPPPGYEAYLGVPLRTAQGAIMGTICSFCRTPHPFSNDEIRTVELFAERAATAVDNYQMYQQQRQFNELLEVEVSRRTEELQHAQERLIHQERLAALGEFASMIVHEVRNPVTTMTIGLQHFEKNATTAGDRERVALALAEAERLQNLLSELLMFARPQELQLELLNLSAFLTAELLGLQQMPEANGRSLHFNAPSHAVLVMGDRSKLKQVLINLVKNACEAIAPGETVQCRVYIDALERATLEVQNGGAPIPPDQLTRLTQPFFSTKPEGTGLGLAIVKRIVEAHCGVLAIESNPSRGTVVRISLPSPH